MASATRRLFSTTLSQYHPPSPSAASACAELIARCPPSIPLSIRTQLLDANQLHLLNITLNRSPTSYHAPPAGTPLPPGYHLVYFTPSIAEAELGLDGTDRTVNPLRPFTRRMWAGGALTWTQDARSLLRVGQQVRETTRLLSAEPKALKNGGEMLVVGVEKVFENEAGVALVDTRNWVFQVELTPENPGKAALPRPPRRGLPDGGFVRDMCQSETTLFRFSALTFNAHKIHFLPEWCREVEGHRGAVVHGPLNLIHMLDLWRDVTRGGNVEAVPKSIAYRAMSPLYVGEPYRILLDKETKNPGQDREWKADIWDSFGKQSMKGTIVE